MVPQLDNHQPAIANHRTITVRTYKDNGPYFAPTVMKYSATTLKEVVFHSRMAMEDGEDYIGVFHGDRCMGAWENDAEPEPDGEGGWYMPSPCYLLRRPEGPMKGHFNSIVALLQN